MKSPSQLLMVALAVVFAVALCLTIALICLGASQKEDPPDTTPPDRTRYYIPGTTTTYLAPPTEEITTEAETDSSCGMVFRSSGNGICVLESVGSCRDAFAVIPDRAPNGDRVVGISARAFYGCRTVAAIQIPAGVTAIGDLAFADCPNLVYISVSESNTRFCDAEGVLYTSDGSELILYPARHAGSVALIPATVREIADMAFYNCAYLEEIRFNGSPAQWEAIRIGTKNYSLTAASVVFYAAS